MADESFSNSLLTNRAVHTMDLDLSWQTFSALPNRTLCNADPPIKMVFDPLLDEPERMMGLIVEIPSNFGQDLGCNIGDVIAGVGVA